MVNKKELINDVAEATSLSKTATKDIIESIVANIGDSLNQNKAVKIDNFGTFSKATVKRRKRGTHGVEIGVSVFESSRMCKVKSFEEVFSFNTMINS